ncbi:MAG TPA: Rieske 2Fe-2S domain-containing protein [Acidiferrobacteraceae bacterium]|nr:Rieske 2Fe-2S domain-containing protein [Acidiferrobacteraceae bacterium]
MADLKEPRICASTALAERGLGYRFECVRDGRPAAAFVVRHEGRPRAFFNHCPHRGHELDWTPGVFYDAEGHLLVCASHGARYDPATGQCRSGPCSGALEAIAVVEEQGWILLG